MKCCGNCAHSIKTIRLVRTPFDSEYDAFGVPSSVMPCKKVQWRCAFDPVKWKDTEENYCCDRYLVDVMQEFLEPDLDKIQNNRGVKRQ